MYPRMSSATAITDDLERRRASRVKFGKWRVLIKADGRESIVAWVWDLSPTGACLLVGEADLPAVIKIEFDGVPRVAEVRWRRSNFVGVHLYDALF